MIKKWLTHFCAVFLVGIGIFCIAAAIAFLGVFLIQFLSIWIPVDISIILTLIVVVAMIVATLNVADGI